MIDSNNTTNDLIARVANLTLWVGLAVIATWWSIALLVVLLVVQWYCVSIDTREKVSGMFNALKVIESDAKIHAYLSENDPQALRQVKHAIARKDGGSTREKVIEGARVAGIMLAIGSTVTVLAVLVDWMGDTI